MPVELISHPKDLVAVDRDPQESSEIDVAGAYPREPAPLISQEEIQPQERVNLRQESQRAPTSSQESHLEDQSRVETQVLDVFDPFFDPEMFNWFPYSEMVDFSPFDTSPLSLDYFDFELHEWDTGNEIT